jgi:hypothetical protein
MDFNLSNNWWVSQLQKSKFAVLVLGFEKLGLELYNCGRTAKNAYWRIYSLWLQLPSKVTHLGLRCNKVSNFLVDHGHETLLRILKCFTVVWNQGKHMQSWCLIRGPTFEAASRPNYGRQGHGPKRLLLKGDVFYQNLPMPHLSIDNCFLTHLSYVRRWCKENFTH